MTVLDLRGADVAIRGTVGTDVELSITFTDSAGDAVDVSGYTAVADVLRNGTSVAEFADAVSGDGSNILTLTLTDAQTTTIGNERSLTWRLSMTSGTVTEHWIAGEFRLYTAGHPQAGSGSSSATVSVTGSVTAAVNVSTSLATLDGRYAPIANPTFTGNVVVPDADAATEAMNRQTADARYGRLETEIDLPLTGFVAAAGTPVASQIQGVRVVSFPDAEVITAIALPAWRVPENWNTVIFSAIWCNLGAGAGAVEWRLVTPQVFDVGDAVPTLGLLTAVAGTAGTLGVVIETDLNPVARAVTPGELVVISLRRQGTGVADTLANAAGLIALRVRRVS